PDRWLVEASELACMELRGLGPQELDCRQADHQMFAHRTVIEGVGGTWQLDLPMERLVGNAKQRAIGHAQAISLCRHRARFHVDRNGMREIESSPLLITAPLLDAIVSGHI